MEVELKFSLAVGALVRREVIKKIKDVAFQMDLKINVEEDKGLVESTYRITVRGEYDAVKTFKAVIDGWISICTG